MKLMLNINLYPGVVCECWQTKEAVFIEGSAYIMGPFHVRMSESHCSWKGHQCQSKGGEKSFFLQPRDIRAT